MKPYKIRKILTKALTSEQNNSACSVAQFPISSKTPSPKKATGIKNVRDRFIHARTRVTILEKSHGEML